jgi:hypothetical protein
MYIPQQEIDYQLGAMDPEVTRILSKEVRKDNYGEPAQMKKRGLSSTALGGECETGFYNWNPSLVNEEYTSLWTEQDLLSC